MNVWILNHYADTPHQQATRSYDLGKQLVIKGHQVTIFASSFSHYRFTEEQLQPGEKWKVDNYDGVRFIWVRTTPYKGNTWRRAVNMLSYAWRAFWVGARLEERPDVIIGTCVHPFAPLSAYLLSVLKGSRFFYEVTDLWPQTLVDMGALSERNPITWGLRLLERFLFAKSEKIISLLPYVAEYLKGNGIPGEKAVWIPNGVDLSIFENLRTYDGGTSDAFTVMYLGGHSSYHGLEVVLDAARILQEEGWNGVRFVLVGDGAEKPNLVAYSDELGLQNVEFRGLVPKRELFKVLGEADALVYCFRRLPLLKYGVSPVKVFDYLASGRPVLYAVDGSNNPVAEAGAGITISPEDPMALAKAVKKLVSMGPEARIRMGSQGLEFVKRYHSIGALADRLESALSAI